MLRRSIVLAALLALVAAPAFAQAKAEASFNVGYTISDGVSFTNPVPVNGVVFNRVDPKDSVSFGLGIGFFINHEAEVEFMWNRQPTKLEATGTGPAVSGDMKVDNYHGNFVFNFGEEDAKARPFLYIGLGATNFGESTFPNKTFPSVTKFSWALGAGVKVYPSPHAGFRAGIRWVPTYIKTDAAGWWCDPYWGCAPVGNVQYANQLEFSGGITFRFGG
ncbi:MAG TPA: outer membrane beta-barrel protein [Vicinamibacterales bacterium]|nr:outer membrane beta-barrel protein [Vicinamibacterales bacterium]